MDHNHAHTSSISAHVTTTASLSKYDDHCPCSSQSMQHHCSRDSVCMTHHCPFDSLPTKPHWPCGPLLLPCNAWSCFFNELFSSLRLRLLAALMPKRSLSQLRSALDDDSWSARASLSVCKPVTLVCRVSFSCRYCLLWPSSAVFSCSSSFTCTPCHMRPQDKHAVRFADSKEG